MVSSSINSSKPESRVAVFSMRHLKNHVSRACSYVFEDVICNDLDNADLIAPKSKIVGHYSKVLTPWVRGLQALLNSSSDTERIHLDQDYELFFFCAAQPRDLFQLKATPNWRQRSRVAVCWLHEIWLKDLDQLDQVLAILNEFDHVICAMYHTTTSLASKLSVPVSYLTWGVDTLLFCPYPTPPKRVIDVCRVGALGDNTHNALVDYADQTGSYYYYNSIQGRHVMSSISGHRGNYAGTLKRSKYFLSYLAKVVHTNERATQEEFGLRYIEGVAAGAVLLGHSVQNEAYIEHLGWPDAVIETEYDSEHIVETLRILEADPSRTEEISRRNTTEALMRHDHLFRWERILELANMKPIGKMAKRKTRLVELVDMARKGDV